MQQAIRKATPLAQSPSKSGGVEISRGVEIELKGVVDNRWQLAGCLAKVGGFWTGKAGVRLDTGAGP